jgi:hypothetical protein
VDENGFFLPTRIRAKVMIHAASDNAPDWVMNCEENIISRASKKFSRGDTHCKSYALIASETVDRRVGLR